MKWKDAKRQLLGNEARRKAYQKVDLAYEIGKMISDARIARGMTQAKLAELLDSHQPSIARIEKGNYLPTFAFLERVAEVFHTQLLPPSFEFMQGDRRNSVLTITKPLSVVHNYSTSMENFIIYDGSHANKQSAGTGSHTMAYQRGIR